MYNNRNNRRILRITLAVLLGYLLVLTYGLGRQLVDADAGIDGGTNAYRQSQGLPSLATSNVLTQFAAERARQIWSPTGMGENFYHQYWWWGPSGCQSIGENLVYRIPAASDPAAYAVQAWINSAPHRANMLGDFQVIGSATYIGPEGGQYSVELFGKNCGGTPAPAPAPAPAPKPAPAPAPAPAPSPKVQNTQGGTPPAPVTVLPDTAMETP